MLKKGRKVNLNELPAGEIILMGLRDLHNGESNTIGALLVAIAATRLTEGVRPLYDTIRRQQESHTD